MQWHEELAGFTGATTKEYPAIASQRRPSAYLVAAAIASSLGTVAAATLTDAMVAAGVAACTTVLVVASFALKFDRKPASRDVLVARAAEQAEEGRKLAIFDRGTGLYALWYVASRCDEECYRSVRFKLPFSIFVVEAAPGANESITTEKLVRWLKQERRRSDIPGCLGPGLFVLLMPQTNEAAARQAARRMLRSVPQAQVGIALHLEDGGNFQQLVEAAKSRLGQELSTSDDDLRDGRLRMVA